jgi:hypothetical protein
MAIEYQIKITGGISIPESLDTKKAVMVGVEVDLFSAEKRDKQDGDFVIIYKGRAVGFPIVSQGEKKYKAQIKNKKSQLWRWKIQEYGEDYDAFMSLILDNSDEVIDFVRKLRQQS